MPRFYSYNRKNIKSDAESTLPNVIYPCVLLRLFLQIFILYCKFIITRPFKWGILGACGMGFPASDFIYILKKMDLISNTCDYAIYSFCTHITHVWVGVCKRKSKTYGWSGGGGGSGGGGSGSGSRGGLWWSSWWCWTFTLAISWTLAISTILIIFTFWVLNTFTVTLAIIITLAISTILIIFTMIVLLTYLKFRLHVLKYL